MDAQRRLAELEAELVSKDQRIAELKVELRARDARIAEIEQQLALLSEKLGQTSDNSKRRDTGASFRSPIAPEPPSIQPARNEARSSQSSTGVTR